MAQLAEVPKNEIVVAPVTPMHLIERAAAAGASIEQMQQLFELKLRVEADEARKAFNGAMAAFKKNPPRINRNISKKAGNIDLHYASLDNVVDTITPALSDVGIRHRWEVKQDAALISVSCILSHDLGHCEVTTLTAPADSSGSKNSIQAIASTVTYLQRYTLLSATGMAAAGTDNDGGGVGPEVEEGRHKILHGMERAQSEDELTHLYRAGIKDALQAKDYEGIKMFDKARDKRRRELAGEID